MAFVPIVLPHSEQHMILPRSCHTLCPSLETHSFSAMALLTVTPNPSGSRVGHGHGDALRFGCGRAFVHLAVSRCAVGSEHALLGANVTLFAERDAPCYTTTLCTAC